MDENSKIEQIVQQREVYFFGRADQKSAFFHQPLTNQENPSRLNQGTRKRQN